MATNISLDFETMALVNIGLATSTPAFDSVFQFVPIWKYPHDFLQSNPSLYPHGQPLAWSLSCHTLQLPWDTKKCKRESVEQLKKQISSYRWIPKRFPSTLPPTQIIFSPAPHPPLNSPDLCSYAPPSFMPPFLTPSSWYYPISLCFATCMLRVIAALPTNNWPDLNVDHFARSLLLPRWAWPGSNFEF